jgi:hypothetical protein
MTTDRKLIPYEEARHMLGGIGLTTFHGLINDGCIERVKIGRRGFITQASIDTFIGGLKDG